jgi:hypothetical protein
LGATLEVGACVLEEEIILAKARLLLIVLFSFLDEEFQFLSYPRRLFGLNQNLLQRAYTGYLKGGVVFFLRYNPYRPQKQEAKG